MILVGIGSNLPSSASDAPEDNCRKALELIGKAGIKVAGVSRFYKTAPVPASDQPWYVNAVASVETDLPPEAVLEKLLEIEAAVGRERAERNAARIVDLDLLAYDNRVLDGDRLTLPHPRLPERAFVLLPLKDIAPDWVHPVTKQSLAGLVGALDPAQKIEILD